MVISDGNSSDVEEKLEKWQRSLDNKENNLNIHFSVSAGYSIGEGKRIDEIINEADKRMYEDIKIVKLY